MIYHIVVGDMAAAPLQEAVASEPSMQGEVLRLRDILHVGPIQKEEGSSFSVLRSGFWQQVLPNEKQPVEVDDMERLLEASAAMYKDETINVWFWMAPSAADICAYYWMLPYLSKHAGRFYLVNIAGLPFLDENGKLHYPKNISEILPRELVKARRLARQVTLPEVEVDGEEWKKLVQEDAGIRVYGGGKKLTSQPDSYYDDQLLSLCSNQFQKAYRVVTQAMNKHHIPTGDVFLGWRLRKMAEVGSILLQGDAAKTLRDFDVKLPSENAPTDQGLNVASQTSNS